MQRGQAPCGELKEKTRGSSSGSETPWSGHARFSEKVSRLAVDHVDHDEPLRERRRGLDRLREPLPEIRLHHEPVDDDLDRVLELLVERDLLLEQPLLAVDLHAREAVAAQLLEDVLELALAVAHDRRVDRELRALVEPQHLLDDLVERLPGDRASADRAVRPADPRVQQPQVVVDLGDRADRRARVARGRLLVDRDRRREPVDRVDVGLLHHLQELARVRGERLDVTALPLGVDRVERERRLPRAGQARHAHERVPRDADGDVLQVVLAGAVDDELFGLAHRRVIVPRRTDVRSTALAFATTVPCECSFPSPSRSAAAALAGCGSDVEVELVWGGPPDAGTGGVVSTDGFATYQREVDEDWERSPALAAGVFLRLDERKAVHTTIDAEAGA